MPEKQSTTESGPDPAAFDPENASVESRLERRSQFSAVLARNGYESALVLARDHVADLDGRHLEILDHLRENSPTSVRALARGLDEDKGQISRALGDLAELDAVELVEEGRAKRPVLAHEHVVIEPIA